MLVGSTPSNKGVSSYTLGDDLWIVCFTYDNKLHTRAFASESGLKKCLTGMRLVDHPRGEPVRRWRAKDVKAYRLSGYETEQLDIAP